MSKLDERVAKAMVEAAMIGIMPELPPPTTPESAEAAAKVVKHLASFIVELGVLVADLHELLEKKEERSS